MRELRRDPTTGDVVAISTDRVMRPRHLAPGRVAEDDPEQCPFCPGHEHATPPTIARFDDRGSWVARAFANKYPALAIEGAMHRKAFGPYGRVSGIGAHEVLVESPDHAIPVHRARGSRPGLYLARDRMRDLARDARFRQLVWFRNSGPEAGASLTHPHAQIVALPTVPPNIRRVVDHCAAHFDEHERELFADLVDFDLEDGRRMLAERSGVAAMCPYAPRAAFEVWLVPTSPQSSFLTATDEVLDATAGLLDAVAGAHATALENPPYNACLYTEPQAGSRGFRWHIRILPRLAQLAGFELGSGAWMHGVLPEESARVLRPLVERG